MEEDRVARWSARFAREWMRAWEDASEEAVERVVALFAPDGVYHATPFSEGRGHAGIRAYESMIRTQQNGRGEVEVLGVAGGLGVFRWRIGYEVAPKREWPRRVPAELMDAPEWETYRAIPFAQDVPTRVEQAGISTLEFDPEGRVTHYRQAFATRLPE